LAYYSELNPIIQEVTSKIMSNDRLKKLLRFKDSDSLDPIVTGKIFPFPKMPDSDTKQDCILLYYFTGGYSSKNNFAYREIKLQFDIICNLDFWWTDLFLGNDLIDAANIPDSKKYPLNIRVYSIMNELDKMFNYKLITFFDAETVKFSETPNNSSTMNKLIAEPFNMMDYSYRFYGVRMSYSVMLNSNNKCDG